MTTNTIPTATIPYGMDHQADLAAFAGVSLNESYHLRLRDQETLCGITLRCYDLPEGRVLVTRQDRYTCYTQATIWPTREAWSQWWYVDRRRGEIDPETGRPFPGR